MVAHPGRASRWGQTFELLDSLLRIWLARSGDQPLAFLMDSRPHGSKVTLGKFSAA